MTEKATEPRRSPLQSRHEALGARLGEVPYLQSGDWIAPLDYGDAHAEHRAIRESVGVFDLTHTGQLMVGGDGSADALNRFLTNDVAQLDRPGKAQYTMACNEDGGVLCDLILLRLGRDGFMLFCSAPNWSEMGHKIDDAPPDEVEVRVLDGTQSVISVQGPEAAAVLARMGFQVGGHHMYYDIGPGTWDHALFNRWSVTGEDGYEIIMDAEVAQGFWDALMKEGVRPCGMDALESLRLEHGHPRYGKDLTRDVTPVEARLAWAVGWSKREFWGKEALDAQHTAGAERRLWGLEAFGDDALAADAAVFDGDSEVGAITSAGYAPTLDKHIALALIDADFTPGTELAVGEAALPVRVVKPPFTTSTD